MADSEAETASRQSASPTSLSLDLNSDEVHTRIATDEAHEIQQTPSPPASSKRLRNPATSSSLPDINSILKRHACGTTPPELTAKVTVTKNDKISEQQACAHSETAITEIIPAKDNVLKHTRNESKVDPASQAPAEASSTLGYATEAHSDKKAVIHASILEDEAVDPCELEAERGPHIHIEAIVGHRFVQDIGIQVLAQWGQEHELPNSWEPETIMHADVRDLLLEYWDTTPGGRYKELRGTGHENDVFALYRYDAGLMNPNESSAPRSKKVKLTPNNTQAKKHPKRVLLVEVEYCGYRGTTWVPDKLLSEDVPVLMNRYWALVGGRPAES